MEQRLEAVAWEADALSRPLTSGTADMQAQRRQVNDCQLLHGIQPFISIYTVIGHRIAGEGHCLFYMATLRPRT